MVLDAIPAAAGLLLAFFLPGAAVAAAVFPEKVRRGAGWAGPLEIAVLGIVGSVALTILLGSLLTALPSGFGTSSSNPSIWVADGAVVVVGLIAWFVRRNAVAPEPDPPADTEAWEDLRALERAAREERTLRRALRSGSLAPKERSELEERLAVVRIAREERVRAAEARHAS